MGRRAARVPGGRRLLARQPVAEATADIEQALALYERKGNLVMAERTRSRCAEFARTAAGSS
jgi:hypothetical protein